MFRRHWTGLPKDAAFPHDLKSLGYFVNDEDEIRSIENPDLYFKYAISRNDRVNSRQRMEFNRATETVVHQRLEAHGLTKMIVPLNTPKTDPHVQIFVSHDIRVRERVIVYFGSSTHDLGIVSGRTCGGPGGINKGSMVAVVQSIAKQASTQDDASPPGIVIANPGQTYWWPEGARALTLTASADIPLSNLVSAGMRYVSHLNQIRENEDSERHIRHMLNTVLPGILHSEAKLDIIAAGDSCHAVEKYFNINEHWDMWADRLSGMVLLGAAHDTTYLTNTEFKEFLAKRTCGFVISDTPLSTILSTASGNEKECLPPLGCPILSSGESQNIENILVKALGPIMSYLEMLGTNPDFRNPDVVPWRRSDPEAMSEDIPEEELPGLTAVNENEMKEELRQLRRWDRYEKTGVAPRYDSDSEGEHDKEIDLAAQAKKWDQV